uniref:NADH dehydrogenase subunit 4L n=1 Tax=Bothriometopus macrocnemis TaxID=475769 RepID=A8VU26_9NEOP|nr:NADH dehydrogenase subunit 4L [Bothriometopus macrocnemis]ABW20542.1 NADH dehydrogenase subunit 4L [Bothriometopus macrocnemis]UTT72565.1 NADH dehydrogenase subunit 4L [Bothriometopus macrocnemis]
MIIVLIILIHFTIIKSMTSRSMMMFLITLESVMMLLFFYMSCFLNAPIISLVTFLVLMVLEGVVGLSVLVSSVKMSVSPFF